MTKITHFIDGKHTQPANCRWLDNKDPATAQVYSQIADGTADDVDAAVTAAVAAFPLWSATPAAQRSEILRKLAQLIEDDLPALAAAESQDNGKPLAHAAEIDIPRAAANFRFFADAIGQSSTEAHAMDAGAINYTLRQPLGAVACISPWNLPLYLLTWKIAPALASGNTVVAKPSEVTPMTAYLLGDLCNKAGLPAGVLNLIHGTGANVGTRLVTHPDIKAVSFTGSTRTGAEIATNTAPLFRKLSLEMGGKNPTLVFADCDFDKTVAQVLRAAYSNQGQICLCGSRILVERSIYPQFKQALLERVRALRVGDPLAPKSQQGAIVSKQHFEKILQCIEVARQEGGEILCGGQRVIVPGRCENGYFIAPTLIAGLGQQCRTNQEEIFGPVATIQPFDSDEEALQLANATQYGLAASIWTGDVSRAHRLASRINAGVVWINCWMLRDLRTPFGGAKDSGMGREGGWEALRFFSEAKNVCIQFSDL